MGLHLSGFWLSWCLSAPGGMSARLRWSLKQLPVPDAVGWMAFLNGMSVFEASGFEPFLCCGFSAPGQPMGMLLRQAVLLPESQAMH